MSHYHDPDDGFPNVEEMDGSDREDRAPLSFIKTASTHRSLLRRDVIGELHKLGQAASVTPEIRRYLQDIVAFLRVERGVDGGITPYASVCFLDLAK